MRDKTEYSARLEQRREELRTLYFQLYQNDKGFCDLLEMMKDSYHERSGALKQIDNTRAPNWYQSNELLGMCLYVEQFAGTLRGVQKKLSYLRELGVNYLHLMPLLDTVDERSDGGYAVADFRKVKPNLGSMEDLEKLTAACHDRGIACCMDFVMNHTSEDHEWAKRARSGDKKYQNYYFFCDDWDIPKKYEKYVQQVFPTTAPGNFTYLADIDKIVLTSFYPYQWDLNYHNPKVFHEMAANLLYLANKGIDVIRVDAVPYIWKELGTNCRNLPQVHTIVRMLRLICEIVCPSTVLLGEVVMAPEKLAPYFGSPEQPECHILYNATGMCTIWHTVATRDTRLLKHQLDAVNALPREDIFLNYLRCHDDIGWGLDFPFLQKFNVEETPHKAYLNAFFTGEFPGSFSKGERYNDDPRLGDARLCGTTASLTGAEKAEQLGDAGALSRAEALNLMLHAFIMMQSGIPVLYSGDEIGQLNDTEYHNDPKKAADSRYLHRGKFLWDMAKLRNDTNTRQGRQFRGLKKLYQIRRENTIFSADAEVWTFDPGIPGDISLLGIKRRRGGQTCTAVYNFSEFPKHVLLQAGGIHKDLLTDKELLLDGTWELPPYGFLLLLGGD